MSGVNDDAEVTSALAVCLSSVKLEKIVVREHWDTDDPDPAELPHCGGAFAKALTCGLYCMSFRG